MQNKKSIYLLIGVLILSLNIGFSQSSYYNNLYDDGTTLNTNGFSSGSILLNDSIVVVTEFVDSIGTIGIFRLSYQHVGTGLRMGTSEAIYEPNYYFFTLPGHHSLLKQGSNLYSVGCKQNAINDSALAFLLKYSLDGNLIDTHFYNLGAKISAFQSIIERSGFLYVTGSLFYDDFTGDAMIAKLDTNGNIIDYQTYGGSQRESAFSLDTTTNGGFIASGWTESYGNGSSGYPDFYVINVDSNLNLGWYKTFGFANEFDGGYVKTTSDGNYLLFGSKNSPSVVGAADAWIAKIDQSGDTIWTKYLLTTDPENDYWDYNEINEVIELSNGNYAVSLQTMGTFGHSGLGVPIRLPIGYFMLLNPSGDTLYSRRLFIRSSDNYPRSMVQSSDGGFVIGGFVFASDVTNSQDGWLVKLDSNYCESDTCNGYTGSVGIPEPNSSINNGWLLFPNPSEVGFTIAPPPNMPTWENYSVNIHNYLGQELFTAQSMSNTYVETNTWANGIYTIRVLDANNRNIFSGKIVVSK